MIAVAPGSSAEQAGIRPGDVLQSIDGISVITQAGAQRLASAVAGESVRLVFEREGKPITTSLVLGQQVRAAGGPTKIITGYLSMHGSPGTLNLEIWSDDPIIIRDSTDTIVLRIGTGTVIKLGRSSSEDSSGSRGRGAATKKPEP